MMFFRKVGTTFRKNMKNIMLNFLEAITFKRFG